jgi:hypothetical protein
MNSLYHKLSEGFENHGNAAEKPLDSFSDTILRSVTQAVCCRMLYVKPHGQFIRGRICLKISNKWTNRTRESALSQV